MDKRHKDLLRRTVGDLRRALAGGEDARGEWQRGDLDRELERLGIAPDGTRTALSALPDLTDADRRAHEAAVAALAEVPAERLAAARAEVVERAAYTWINRLLALRAMETRGLIDETLRANPAYSGASEALFVLRQTDPARCAGPDGGRGSVLEDARSSRRRLSAYTMSGRLAGDQACTRAGDGWQTQDEWPEHSGTGDVRASRR